MWEEFWHFVVSIVWNHFTLSAGCALTVLAGFYEKFHLKQSLSVRAYGWIVFVLFIFACFQAWQQEHESNFARQHDLHNQELATRAEREKLEMETEKEQGCQIDLSHARGVVEAQSAQVGREQGTMNACILALTKNNAPEPLRISVKLATVVGVEGQVESHKEIVAVAIAESNKTITPIRAVLECDEPFKLLGATLAGERWIIKSGQQQIDSRKASINIDSPAWRQGVPLVFSITAMDKRPNSCTASQL